MVCIKQHISILQIFPWIPWTFFHLFQNLCFLQKEYMLFLILFFIISFFPHFLSIFLYQCLIFSTFFPFFSLLFFSFFLLTIFKALILLIFSLLFKLILFSPLSILLVILHLLFLNLYVKPSYLLWPHKILLVQKTPMPKYALSII
jgi:hypothetical protein